MTYINSCSEIRRHIRITIFVAALILLSACSPAKQPFLTVHACLVDEKGISEFLAAMRAIAQDNRMNYIDGSAETQRVLQFLHDSNSNVPVNKHQIDIELWRRDGIGLGAFNLGLPDYQVLISFDEGSDPAKGREFSNRVIQKLSKRWPLETVLEGKSAFPMKNCGN